LAAVARTYHTTTDAIAEANNLSDGPLAPESKLIIPIAPGKAREASGTYAHAITRYKVRKGDTTESVADEYGIPVKMVRSWNRLKSNSLAGKKVLYLHLPVAPGAHETQVAEKSSSKSSKHKTDTQARQPACRRTAAGHGARHPRRTVEPSNSSQK
jgi:LysM repeat protein